MTEKTGTRVWEKIKKYPDIIVLGLSEDELRILGNMFLKNKTNESLQGRWRRMRNNNVAKAWKESANFKASYCAMYVKQNGCCAYCGCKVKNFKTYRKGTRGKTLEVDRKNPTGKYGLKNCTLACYPCNNAKSNIFSAEDFKVIGAIIGGLGTHGGSNIKKKKCIKILMSRVMKITCRS